MKESEKRPIPLSKMEAEVISLALLNFYENPDGAWSDKFTFLARDLYKRFLKLSDSFEK